MPLPQPLARYLCRLLTGYTMTLAVILCFSMVVIPAPAAAVEAATQVDPRAIRVATVAHRLSLANAALCEAVQAPETSFRLLDKDVAHGKAVLDQDPRDGTVSLRVLERNGEQQLDFTAFGGCPTKVTLIEDEAVNAWADGSSIRITTGLLARCQSDDDLALVLGHEMAHNLLRHRWRLVGRIGASGLLPSGEAAARELHDDEEEADRIAVSLSMAAGYDLGGAVEFMDGLLDRSLARSETHPGPQRRLALLRDAISDALRDGVALPAAD